MASCLSCRTRLLRVHLPTVLRPWGQGNSGPAGQPIRHCWESILEVTGNTQRTIVFRRQHTCSLPAATKFNKQIQRIVMVPTDHDIPFSKTFQGLLRYIFKDFSRTFLCSFKHLFAKKWSTMDFSNKTYRDHLILSSPEKWWGGGERGDLGMCVLTLLDDLLYYGYNTNSNNYAWKGGLGVLPQKNFIRISTKSCNSRQFWRVH